MFIMKYHSVVVMPSAAFCQEDHPQRGEGGFASVPPFSPLLDLGGVSVCMYFIGFFFLPFSEWRLWGGVQHLP